MGAGTVHNGVKLSVGQWLIDTINNWLSQQSANDILLIEAPLVGHRFIELATIQDDAALESFFKSEAFQMLVPIPSKKVHLFIKLELYKRKDCKLLILQTRKERCLVKCRNSCWCNNPRYSHHTK